MFLRKPALILTAVGLVAALVFEAWQNRRRGVYFSDPATARPNPEYASAATLGTNAPALTNLANSLHIAETTNAILLSFPFKHRSGDGLPPDAILTGTSSVPLPNNAVVHLDAIASGWNAPQTNFDSIEIPGRLYTAAGAPADPAALPGITPSDLNLRFEGMYPAVKFFLSATNLAEFKVLACRLFDARTKQTLMRSYSSGKDGHRFSFETQLFAWHPASLELAVDLAIGPIQTHILEVRERAQTSWNNGSLTIAAVVDGKFSRTSNNYDGRTNHFKGVLEEAGLSSQPRSSVVILSSPSGSGAPLDLEFVDSQGKPLLVETTSANNSLIIVSLRAARKDVAQLRVKVYPTLYRVIFQIPELPGLPPENRQIANLFDSRIPFIRFNHDWEILQAVGNLAQMDVAPANSSWTNVIFPLIRTNTTPRELLQEASRHLVDKGETFAPNPETHRIEVRSSPIVELLRNLKKLLP